MSQQDDDEALARALQDHYEKQAKKRRTARKSRGTARASATPGEENRSRSKSPMPAANVSHSAATAEDTTNDEDLARQLYEKEKAAARKASAARKEKQQQKAVVEDNGNKMTVEIEEKTPEPDIAAVDTSKDEELARKLFEREKGRARKAREERKNKRDPPASGEMEEEKEEIKPPVDTSNDEELARKLMEREVRRAKQQRSSQPPPPSAPVEVEPNDPPVSPRRTQRDLSAPSDEENGDTDDDDVIDIADDAALARKLEQELQDEEMARRMNEKEAKRRRRTSYLARKNKAEKKKQEPKISAGFTAGKEEVEVDQIFDSHYATSSDDDVPLEQPPPPAVARGRKTKRAPAPSSNKGTNNAVGRPPRSSSNAPRPIPQTRNHNKTNMRSVSPMRQAPSRSASPAGMRSKSPGIRPAKKPSRGVSPAVRQQQAPIIFDLHDEESDREFAQRLEQEGRDEAVARAMTMEEQQQIKIYEGHRSAACSCKRIIGLAVPLVVIVAAVIGLVFAFAGSDGLNPLTGTPFFRDEDPFNGILPDDANRWNNGRNSGLGLTVLNALESKWDDMFDRAINEWDSGNPDALTLRTQKISVDTNCGTVDGRLKVCNGNYGDTKWRGINQVILAGGYIIKSIAKLNEFYLDGSSQAQRQYTMCHEIGHGFGLPHTDENFNNKDLGNCMDYTSNPAVNQSPDDSNYSFLMDLYGEIGGRRRRRNLRQRRTATAPMDEISLSNRDPSELLPEEDLSVLVPHKQPDNLNFRIAEVSNTIEYGGIVSEIGYKATCIHSNDHARAWSVDLGDGFSMELHMLLVEPNNDEER